MGYRRVFIIRKDLHLSSGKLAAMVAHCAEAYCTRMIKNDVMPLRKGGGLNHGMLHHQKMMLT